MFASEGWFTFDVLLESMGGGILFDDSAEHARRQPGGKLVSC